MTDELQIRRKGQNWRLRNFLPRRDRSATAYEIEYATATAVVIPDPDAGVWRIPYIVRDEPGDMKALLDEFVLQTNRGRIKFVNVEPDGTYQIFADVFDVPDARDLADVLHGFEETTETWESPDEDGTEPVRCLEGEWLPRWHQ